MNWKKKDAVLILTVLLIAGAAFGVHEFAGGDGADTVTVKVDGKVTGTYPLAKDQKIRINGGTNILTIKNGKAKMTDADCPDQLNLVLTSTEKMENITDSQHTLVQQLHSTMMIC